MADDKQSTLDVLALLGEIHGSQAQSRGEAVEQALRTLERTHRTASLAMRQFEREGLPARSARVKQPPKGPAGAQATEAPHGPPTPHPQGQGPAAPAQAAKRTVDAAAEEVTAVWRPPAQPEQKPAAGALPAPPAQAPPPKEAGGTPAAGAETPAVFSGRGKDWLAREPTRTQVVRKPPK